MEDLAEQIWVNNVEVKQKHHIILVGTKITADLDVDTEVTWRIRKSWNYFWSLKVVSEIDVVA